MMLAQVTSCRFLCGQIGLLDYACAERRAKTESNHNAQRFCDYAAAIKAQAHMIAIL